LFSITRLPGSKREGIFSGKAKRHVAWYASHQAKLKFSGWESQGGNIL
jgi:hypothetical protein